MPVHCSDTFPNFNSLTVTVQVRWHCQICGDKKNFISDHILYTGDPIQLSDIQLQLSDTQFHFVQGLIPDLSPTLFWCYAWHNSLSSTSCPWSDTLTSYRGDKIFFVQAVAHIFEHRMVPNKSLRSRIKPAGVIALWHCANAIDCCTTIESSISSRGFDILHIQESYQLHAVEGHKLIPSLPCCVGQVNWPPLGLYWPVLLQSDTAAMSLIAIANAVMSLLLSPSRNTSANLDYAITCSGALQSAIVQ